MHHFDPINHTFHVSYPSKNLLDEQIKEIVNNHVIYTTTDLKGIIERVSPAFCERSGYTSKELLGRSHSLLRAPDTDDSVYADLWETIESDRIWRGEIKNIAKDGQAYWIKCVIRPLFGEAGKKVGYIALRDNITREKEIEEYALIDEVTKAYNRKKINQDIMVAIERYERYATPCSLVMLDIDYFKGFNDQYGHLTGDEILIQISAFIKTQVRASDIFARWGGDEFALLAPGINSSQAALLCEKLRCAVADQTCMLLQKSHSISEPITCSFGVTAIKDGDTIDSLIGRTDRALYLAKEHGRNSVEVL